MILLAGGDSLIWGSELSDALHRHSNLTYTALLANKFGYEYVCAAQPGAANNAISRLVLAKAYELVEIQQNFCVIVQWSFSTRYEFRFNYNTKQRNSPWYSINPWTIETDFEKIRQSFVNHDSDIEINQLEHIKRAESTGIKKFAEEFYSHVGNSEYYELYSSLKEFLYLQNFFIANQIKYIFTCADNTFFNSEEYFRSKDIYLESLHDSIDWDKWYFFPNTSPAGFYTWARNNNYRMGTTHPLEESHHDASKLIMEKFDEMVFRFNN